MRHRTRMIILGMGILIALCLVALQNALAADDPPTIYLVEEDHRSVSGQLSQAERLFELYFSNAVRDILLEGYVGNTIPVGGLMALLPDGVRDFVHENAFGSRMLSNYMPEVVPTSQSRRFSIAFPEFAQANVSAAEFVASILPVRLHPGETDQTYLRWDKFEPSLCENLDKRIREQAPKDASRLGSADAQELKARFESLQAMSSYDSRYEAEYDAYIEFLLRLLTSGDSTWPRLAKVWRNACGPDARRSVISIERLLELYQDAEELTQSRGWSSGWREWWERDVRFLRARAEASDEMARRTIALAKGLHRNLAVVTGLAHSAKMQALLRQEPGIRLMVIGFEPGFGEIKQLNLSPAGWWGKQNGSPSKESLDYRLQWVEALRRPAPVVQTTLYQARHELAAISDRLARALYDYAEGRSSNPPSASRSSGRFAYLDASSAQTVRLSASSGATNELAGFLVRAETRFHHTRESLWLAMWRSNYLLPPSEDADGNISAVSVRDFFQRLRRFTQEQYRDRFIEGKIAAREPDDPRDSETNPIRPRVAVLSLGLRACASMVRERAERCLRGG